MADGNIVAAKSKLEDAVHRLCAPQSRVHRNHTLAGPSLYAILSTGLSARQGDTRTPAQSLPPLWVDACQLRLEIDSQVRAWRPRINRETPALLHMLCDQPWRPQDTEQVTAMARQIRAWCDSIINLFDPEHKKFISAACPSCGKRVVYKRDTAGEMVRQPALVVVTNIGAKCQHCDASWAPDKYLFLCKLLNFELPEGVLE